jgi:hypothetical protein
MSSSEAYHELAVELFGREEYNAAIEAYHQAWVSAVTLEDKLRIVADIASALSELEYVDEARIAALLVRERSADPTLRGAAGVNLMELARLERDKAEFTRYGALVRQDLPKLPNKVQVDYYFESGLGFETFGDPKRTRAQYRRAIEIAESHGLGHEVFRVDCALDSLVDGLSNVLPPLSPPPLPAVSRIADALSRARATAH